jgi:hypothetical protein
MFFYLLHVEPASFFFRNRWPHAVEVAALLANLRGQLLAFLQIMEIQAAISWLG